jgi:hypothetical protein
MVTYLKIVGAPTFSFRAPLATRREKRGPPEGERVSLLPREFFKRCLLRVSRVKGYGRCRPGGGVEGLA